MSRGGFIRLGFFGALVVLACLLLWYPTEEKRVRQATDALIDAANAGPSDLSRALGVFARPDVRVTIDDLPEPLVGRQAIVAAAEQAALTGQQARLRIEAVEVHVEGRRARLVAELAAAQAEVPELRRPRPASLLFEKHERGFWLVSADIGAERLDQPEARP